MRSFTRRVGTTYYFITETERTPTQPFPIGQQHTTDFEIKYPAAHVAQTFQNQKYIYLKLCASYSETLVSETILTKRCIMHGAQHGGQKVTSLILAGTWLQFVHEFHGGMKMWDVLHKYSF